jgi:heterotetrameric sarcosine oxidase delta subunit
MLRIPCPWCGTRDEVEFRYRGDASVSRPAAEGTPEEFTRYVYGRENPLGWHLEWWLHVGGCRRLLKVERHTLSHEIRWVGVPDQQPSAESPQPVPQRAL